MDQENIHLWCCVFFGGGRTPCAPPDPPPPLLNEHISCRLASHSVLSYEKLSGEANIRRKYDRVLTGVCGGSGAPHENGWVGPVGGKGRGFGSPKHCLSNSMPNPRETTIRNSDYGFTSIHRILLTLHMIFVTH